MARKSRKTKKVDDKEITIESLAKKIGKMEDQYKYLVDKFDMLFDYNKKIIKERNDLLREK